MSGAGVEDVCSAIAEAARQLDVAYEPDTVTPILTAYEQSLADAVIVLSMDSGKGPVEELDYSVTVAAAHGDPYDRALEHGFLPATEHPVGRLSADIREHCPIGGYAIDCGAVGGFKKTYTFFPTDDLQTLATLGTIEAMPPGVAANAAAFARLGIDDHVTMISIDYRKHTVNIYFGKLTPECRDPRKLAALFSEIGLPEPSAELMAFARKSFAIYATLNWDSARIERICFAVITQDPTVLESRTDVMESFARTAPRSYQEDRTIVYGITLAPDGEYYKLGSYYQINAQTRRLLVAFDAIK